MATVTITISDADEEGGVNLKAEFDPPLDRTDESNATIAQCEGAFLIEVMQRRASGQTLDQIADEMDEESYGEVGGYEQGEVTFAGLEDDNEHS